MIDKNSVLKVYGPYDFEKKKRDSPYITILFDKKKAKVNSSNTELNLEDILPNSFTGKNVTFEELKILDENQLVWTANTRSRSTQKKHDTMELIILHGTELFTSQQEREFSMRKLARRCGMTVGNLYAYVDSKRDLWFAITQRHYNELDQLIENEIQNFKGKNIDLLKNIIKKFMAFSRSSIPRHKMMFFTPAPLPPKVDKENEAPHVGQYEEIFEEKKTLNKVTQLITRANENEEINIDDPLKFTYFIFGVVQGNVIEGFEYGRRITNEEIQKGIQKTEDEWKSFRQEIMKDYDKLMLDEIDRCLSLNS